MKVKFGILSFALILSSILGMRSLQVRLERMQNNQMQMNMMAGGGSGSSQGGLQKTSEKKT